jgi:hypothetical protein
MTTHENRLAEIRSAIEAENVSYGELAELQDIAADHPELFAGDAMLAEWAGIPEEQWRKPAPYNYYKARFYVQTAKRAISEGVPLRAHYGYVVRIDPPVHDEGRRLPSVQAWCRTKRIAEDNIERTKDALHKGYFGCLCGSKKQARACCGVPPLSEWRAGE